MPYPKINALHLRVFPLAERKNLLDFKRLTAEAVAAPPAIEPPLAEQIDRLAEQIRLARRRGASVMLAYGAHLVKNGAAPLVASLLEAGYVTHLATQGAGVIHDWEFALQAWSGESVRENTARGCFGAWEETGRWLSLAVLVGAAAGLGLGESLARLVADDGVILPAAEDLRRQIAEAPGDDLCAAKADLLWTMEQFQLSSGRLAIEHPHKAHSILGAVGRLGVPLTVHPGIGYDIIVNHPMYHGGAMGRAAATDARVFAHAVDRLEGGVYLSVGSAIMSPQVFEKALSAANNLRLGSGRATVRDHTIAIVDLQASGGWDWSCGEPPPTNPAYYLRYCKTFYRMGGTLHYLQCDNRLFLAHLAGALGVHAR